LNSIEKPVQSERLLEAAAKILAETGYRNLNFEKLASQLECSQEDLEKNFASPQSLISEVGRLCVSRANAHFGKMLLAAPENRKREAKESLRSFLQFLDTNEDYFRLGLWFYVEKMFQATNTGHLTETFFDKLEEFFESIPSEKSASSRAMLFANSWLTYAWFRWVEFPKMNENQRAKGRLKELENTLVALLD
jgi:AcrR family transcriptional regulator